MSRVYALVFVYILAAVLFFFLATRGNVSSEHNWKMIRLAIDTEPKTLDPISITDTISDGVARKVYNQLVRLEKNDTGGLDVKGDLSEKFEILPDRVTYIFHLRKGVKFHNGREFNAHDVVYSFKRLLSAQSKRPEWLEPMVVNSKEFLEDPNTDKPLGITAEDDFTVKIVLNEPFAPFIQQLCTVNCAIVARECVEDMSKPFARNPVGTGPFKLSEWRNFQTLIFTRHDDYFRGKPKLDAVQFSVIKEHNIQLEQFLKGDLDACTIPYGQVKKIVATVPPEDIHTYDTMRTSYVGIGMPNGKFKDKADLQILGRNKLLRQAILHAIDRDYLCNTVLEGRASPARSILPPGMPCYDYSRPFIKQDLAKAKDLMAKAGYPDGKGLPTFTILHRNDEDTRKMAQAVFGDLERAGFKIELQAREWNKFLDMMDQQPNQLFLNGWVADYPDPDNYLYVLFNTNQWGAPGNATWFSHPKVDEITNKARGLLDMKEREPLYHQVEDILLDECPWAPTYHVRALICLRRNIKGIRERVTSLDTGTEFPNVDFVYVDKEN